MGAAEQGFEEFLRARGDHYLGLACSLCRDHGAGEDLFQSAAERLYRRWSSRRPLDNPDAYFRQILANAAIDGFRRRRRHPEKLTAQVPDRTARFPVDSLIETQHILAVIRKLPARQRTVVVLRVLEDLDIQQTADLLHVSPGTVKSSLSRGLATLRARLSDLDEHPQAGRS